MGGGGVASKVQSSSSYKDQLLRFCYLSHTCAQLPLINARAFVPIWARNLQFGLGLTYFHYFVYASSECPGICIDSPEPSLLDKAINTNISCAIPYIDLI